jgi:rod shape-determining protein MreC
MEIISRYRNLTVLLALILAQLLLLAWQVKGDQDARLIRVWAVTAVTPLAKATDWARGGTGSFFENYIHLRGASEENKRLKTEVGQLRLQNHFLQSQLQTADRARVLLAFQSQVPSKTLPVRVIATGTGMNSRVVYVDRGSVSGVKKGMAVIRPEGIVGKVVASYPTAALVMLMTEQGFAAGVISQKNRVRGTLRGLGSANLSVDYIQNEEKVDLGEWFYTTGDDRIFPKGLPVGMALSVKEGRGGKDIVLQPFALKGGVEEVLIVLDGVHGEIPLPATPGSPDVQVLPAPPAVTQVAPAVPLEGEGAPLSTDADKLLDRYRRTGESQGIVIGQTKGRVPDFTKAPPKVVAPAAGGLGLTPGTVGSAPGAVGSAPGGVGSAPGAVVEGAAPPAAGGTPPASVVKPEAATTEPVKPPAVKPPAAPVKPPPAPVKPKPTISNAEGAPKQ